MAGILIGGLFGIISTGGAYLFGATLFSSVMAGMALGSLFMNNNSVDSNSPTYSFQGINNTKTQLLPIPVVYGRCRVAGNVFYQAYLDENKEKVEQFIGISEGPVHSITGILAGDIDPTTLEDCSVNIYLNSDGNTHDSRGPQSPRPFPNDMAFIAMSLKAQEKLSGNQVITSIVEGRTVLVGTGASATVQFSRNPAWIIRDFLTNDRYGFGIPDTLLDETSFVLASQYCEAIVDGEERFTIDYVVDSQRSGVDHLQAMLSAFRGYLICRNKIELRIDAPVTTYSCEVGLDDVIEGSFSWWQSADEDILNRVIIEWIDPDNAWERTVTIFEHESDFEKRGIIEKSFSLIPITRAKQAARMGAYLIDNAIAVKNFCSFSLALRKSEIEAGDVIALTHDLPGWDKKWFRVVKVADGGDDVISLTCAEYVNEIYNDVALDFPAHVDTNLPNLYECPEVLNLSAVERVTVNASGTILSDIDVFWEDPPVMLRSVEVSLLEESDSQYKSCGSVIPTTENFVIRGLQAEQQVVVRVRATNTMGIRSLGATIGLTLYGKATPPGEPTNLTVVGGFQTMQISWVNPGDADLAHVEIRECDTYNFNDAYTIARVDGITFSRTNLLTFKTYFYWVRAVDTTGNVSQWVGPVSSYTIGIQMEDFVEGLIDVSVIVEQIMESLDIISLIEGLDLEEAFEPAVEKLAETILAVALQNEEDYVKQGNDIVSAKETLRQELIEGISAEASKRLILLAKIDSNIAGLEEEKIVRATKDYAIANEVRLMGALVDENSANIYKESVTRASENDTLASSLASLEAVSENTASAVAVNALAYANIDGTVRSEYTIKTQAVGDHVAVAGIGLIADGQTGISEFVVVANKFFVYDPQYGELKPVFQIVNNQARIDGDIIATGTIQGDRINAESQMQIADGGRLLIGTDGTIQCGNGYSSNTVFINDGFIRIGQVIDGIFRVRQVETTNFASGHGVMTNTKVYIPGYFAREPVINVSINELKGYLASKSDQDQSWRVYPSEITHEAHNVNGGGNYSFTPICHLMLASATTTVNAFSSIAGTTNASWTSDSVSCSSSTTSVQMVGSVASILGTGNAPFFYKRTVTCQLQYSTGGDWGNFGNPYTITISDLVSHPIQMTIGSIAIGSAFSLRAYFTAGNVSGNPQFDAGGSTHEYATSTTTNIRTTEMYVSGNTGQVVQDQQSVFTSDFTPPSGWFCYGFTSNLQISGSVTSQPSTYASVVLYVYGQQVFYADGTRSFSDSNQGTFNFDNTTGSADGGNSFMQVRTDKGSPSIQAVIKLNGGSVTFNLRKPITNSTTVSNSFEYRRVTLTLSSSQILADGFVNWTAFGS